MKKVLVVLCIALAVPVWAEEAGPAPAPGREEWKVPGAFPEFVRQAVLEAPDDVLVGIGAARMAIISQSVIVSRARALAEIARQLSAMSEGMVLDYEAGGVRVNHEEVLVFNERMTRTIVSADLSKVWVAVQDSDSRRAVWTVVYLRKADTAEILAGAEAAVKPAFPLMAAFDSGAGLDEAFSKIKAAEAATGW